MIEPLPIRPQKKKSWLRALSMPPAEILDRLRQYSLSRFDLAAYRLGITPEIGISKTSVPECRFFFSEKEIASIGSLLRQHVPRKVDEIAAQAEKICQHRFDLLGYENLNYGEDIDWQYDAVHRKSAPRKPWFKIAYLEFSQVGDHKVIWELNRHQHWVTLAKAYRLTGEDRFANELLSQWGDWHEQNPYPVGINWASSLEVAFRSLSWLWVYYLLNGCSALPSDFRKDWLRALGVNGRFIEHHLSTYFSPNTHLLGEAVALFFIGTLCPELRPAKRWQHRGWQIILQESNRQVQPDGFHFEQSTYYHVYALDLFLHARTLASRNGSSIPPEFDDVIEKMLEALCALGRTGVVPQLGDDDGGRLFDPRRNRTEHLLDPLATGAVLLNRGDFAACVPALPEETLWLLGESAPMEFDRLAATKPAPESIALESSGLYVMAGSDGNQQLVIDAGSQGAFSAGHGHADALSVTLSAHGRPLLIDRGTFAYVGAESQRDAFRGTGAHNTLQVDGRDQAEPSGPFGWEYLPAVKTERWLNCADFDLFVGSHNGYGRRGVEHRRFVFSLKSNFWLIRDVASGPGKHRLDLRFCLAPGLLPDQATNSAFVDSEGLGLDIVTTEDHKWHRELVPTSVAPVYGHEEPANVMHWSTTTTLPAEFVSLIALRSPQKSALGSARLSQFSRQDGLTAYRLEVEDSEHLFFFPAKSAKWRAGPWSSDSDFLYWASCEDVTRLICCNSTIVTFDDNVVLSSSSKALDWCEVIDDGKQTRVISADPSVNVNLNELPLVATRF
jgi:hypothetical protein